MIKKCRWFGFGCFPVLFVLFSVYQDFRAVEAASTNQTAMAIDSTEEETETPNDSTTEEVTMTPIRMYQENSTYESTTIREHCGGDIVSSEGNISSPNFPNNYGPHKNCTWRITVSQDSRVLLKFTSFQLEQDGGCNYDYVKILDGHGSRSRSLGTFCGSRIPAVTSSSDNKMTVMFKSDVNKQYKGFTAKFEEVSCGANITSNEGNISSPNFPDNYWQFEECVWRITVQEGHPVLTFTHFQLERHSECSYDYVKVLDGHESSSPILGKFCGENTPHTTVSSGNKMTVEFKTDMSGHYGGFFATFNRDKDECATNNGGCQHICRNTIGSYTCACHNDFVLHENLHDCKDGSCTHQIKTPLGEISSPNYPDYYPSGKDCAWLFTTTPGHRIRLVFNEFELEPDQECAYDRIAIYDGDSAESTTLGKFCGSKVPYPILASGNRMYMVFKSDASVQKTGFKATHTTVCGGRVLALNCMEHLYSHAKYGDQNYDNKEDCDWIIEAVEGMRLRLRFLTFEVEHEQECGYDYVEVYDGYDDSARAMGRFCGNKVPPEFFSSRNTLLLRFRSDDTINAEGFSAAYTAVESPDDEIMQKCNR